MTVARIDRPLRLLVVYKKSQLELYLEHEATAMQEMRVREPDLYDRFQAVHEINERAIDCVRRHIEERGHSATFIHRAQTIPDDDLDLIISVGGDGTLLDVSHFISEQCLLGVNSAPGTSVGHYCATDGAGFGDHLDTFQRGELERTALTRLQVWVNDTPVDPPVLNDVLLAHVVPGAVSRYVLHLDDQAEEHKSSGVWISTATGSTSAIQSAGGVIMNPDDTRLQFMVRELYEEPGKVNRLRTGLVDGPIEFLCKMRTGALFVDGHRERIPIQIGDRIRLERHRHPLNLMGFRHDSNPDSPDDSG